MENVPMDNAPDLGQVVNDALHYRRALQTIHDYLMESVKPWDIGHGTVFDIANEALKTAPVQQTTGTMPKLQNCKTCKHLICGSCTGVNECYRYSGWEPKEASALGKR